MQIHLSPPAGLSLRHTSLENRPVVQVHGEHYQPTLEESKAPSRAEMLRFVHGQQVAAPTGKGVSIFVVDLKGAHGDEVESVVKNGAGQLNREKAIRLARRYN